MLHSIEVQAMDHRKAARRKVACRYVLGELSAAERGQFEEHYFECGDCAEDVRALLALSLGARAVLSEMPYDSGAAPALRERPRWFDLFWRWRPRLAYAVVPVFALLVLTAFTSYQSIALRKQLAPQAISEFNLRPDSRGPETAIPIDGRGSFVVLGADVPENADGWGWRIRSADSASTLLEGTAPAPPHGLPFMLLVPTSGFRPGRYVLSLRQTGPKILVARELTYRFRMH